jgi:hypothetical protein
MFQSKTRKMNFILGVGSCVALAVCGVYFTRATAQGARAATAQTAAAAESSNASPIYGITIPPGYRDWKLISLNHLVTDKTKQVRAQLGNDIAVKAFKEGTLPFPDGTIIAALHWTEVSIPENDQLIAAATFPGAHSGYAGPPANVQFMVKDSKKYAATGGWGFADFKDGKPSSLSVHEACFPCHVPAKARDYVFAHYAATP